MSLIIMHMIYFLFLISFHVLVMLSCCIEDETWFSFLAHHWTLIDSLNSCKDEVFLIVMAYLFSLLLRWVFSTTDMGLIFPICFCFSYNMPFPLPHCPLWHMGSLHKASAICIFKCIYVCDNSELRCSKDVTLTLW